MSPALSQRWRTWTSKLQGIAERPWFYPVALLLIGVIAYCYALPALGYYWDDWEVVFLLHTRQLPLLYDYFAFDRPFAWPYQLMYTVFGLNGTAWHIMTLLLRWAGILFIYLSLRMVWPRYHAQLRWLGALMIVYPGFLQQSISGAYNRHFTAFALFGLSLYLMMLAARNRPKAWFLWPLSWITSALQVITIEYFVGLELVRPLLLWLLLGEQPSRTPARRAGMTALLSLPYLLIFAAYFWWRLFIFPQTLARLNYTGDFKFLQDFGGSVSAGVLELLTRGVMDLVYSTLRVWLGPLGAPAGLTLQSRATWFALGVGIVVSTLFAVSQRLRDDTTSSPRSPSLRSLFFLGFVAFLVSAVPIWLTSRQLSGTGRWDDRFSLGAMVGSTLMTVVLVMLLVRVRWQKVILAVLLAASITTQVLTVNRYRLEWATENAYYWQLAWRVPGLKPQTAIFSLEQPSASVPGYDTSFALNVLFDGQVVDASVPYWFFTNDRFRNFEFVPGKSISYKDRNLRFSGSTSDAISVVHQSADRCLQVLDSDYAAQPFYGTGQAQLVGVSNVTRIVTDATSPRPDPGVFGPEPAHTWCYYFEKADLARQLHDWSAILLLEKRARQSGYAPKFGGEYVPFIEAYAQTGDWQKALELSRAAQAMTEQVDPLLCATWSSLSTLPAVDASVLAQARQAFACSTP